jgi:hypothetical protein
MKLNKTAAIASLSLALAGCSTLEKAVFNSNLGKEGVYIVQYQYMSNFGKTGRIETYNLSQKDAFPEKPILFFLHGWSGNLDEYANKEIGTSRLDVMNDVFENRVIMADYSSAKGIDQIFSELDSSFDNFMDEYAENNSGNKPKLIIAGHSLGTQLTRLFVRNHVSDFNKAGLIAGVNEGFDLGMLNSSFKKIAPKYLEKISGKELTEEDSQSINDLMKGSDFFRRINTPTSPIDTQYNFYIFSSKKDNFFIPGKDDGVTRVCSAYPYDLIQSGKFEDVLFSDVIVFEGAVDHSFYNQNILRKILESLKSESTVSHAPIPLAKAKHFKVSLPTLQEIERDNRKAVIKQLLKVN